MAYKKLHLGTRSSCLSKHLGRILVCLLALLILNTSPLLAQLTQSIQGLVTDAMEPCAGAKVTITNEGWVFETVTQWTETTFPRPVGNYDLKCEMQGFKTEALRLCLKRQQVRQNFRCRLRDHRNSRGFCRRCR
jgi:hypothetical protein